MIPGSNSLDTGTRYSGARASRCDAAALSCALARRIDLLVRQLLPGGRREGAEWRCGSLGGERGHSLGVHMSGAKAGVWADFSTGECGDALDLVAQARFGCDKRAAIEWAQSWLGGEYAAVPEYARPVVQPSSPDRDPGSENRRKAALRVFLEAQPLLAGTPAEYYFAARGIDFCRLGRQPRSLRFHPALRHAPSGRVGPALVAAVSDAGGNHVATHRTWIGRRPNGAWGKLAVADPKMTLGSPRGGTIRLWRGASGKPLREAPEGEAVVLGEGIETCLSIALACPELRVLCGVSLANMASVALPPAIGAVILAADNDGENAAAARGLQRAVNALLAQNHPVRLARAPWGGDFNDVLRAA